MWPVKTIDIARITRCSIVSSCSVKIQLDKQILSDDQKINTHSLAPMERRLFRKKETVRNNVAYTRRWFATPRNSCIIFLTFPKNLNSCTFPFFLFFLNYISFFSGFIVLFVCSFILIREREREREWH